MSDYISRDAAWRAVKDVGQKAFDMGEKDMALALMIACEKIEKLPAADVRDVVTCERCKYYQCVYHGTQWEYGFCDRWADGTRMSPDDYCYRGELREEQT